MKNRLDWIAYLLISVNVLLVLALIIFLIYGLEPVYTGPIGDTFGGLLSPVIGVVSIIYIYKTFAAQREQLEDQRNQFDISRIADITYSQIHRIDQTLENLVFYPQGGVIEVQGIAGIYGLNETLKDIFDSEQFAKDNGMDLKNNDLPYYLSIINDNVKPLLHIYGIILNSLRIVNITVDRSNLSTEEGDELRGLLLMNLGNTISLNRYRLLWLLNDANALPEYDYQGQSLHETLGSIQEFYAEN